MAFVLPNHHIEDGKYKITHQLLFQTPLFEINIDDIDNKELEKNIYKLKDSSPKGIIKSNHGGWHSIEQSLNVTNSNQIPIGDAFNPLTNKLMDILQCLPFTPKISKLHNMNIWAMINKKGSYNSTHNHPGCDISGVYYVKVPEGDCGNICFTDPRESYVYGNTFFVERYSGGETIPRYPIEGNMYLFPSSFKHLVNTNTTDEDRIAISFNLGVV